MTRVGDMNLCASTPSSPSQPKMLQADVANLLRGPVGSLLNMHVRRSVRRGGQASLAASRPARPSSGGFSPMPALSRSKSGVLRSVRAGGARLCLCSIQTQERRRTPIPTALLAARKRSCVASAYDVCTLLLGGVKPSSVLPGPPAHQRARALIRIHGADEMHSKGADQKKSSAAAGESEDDVELEGLEIQVRLTRVGLSSLPVAASPSPSSGAHLLHAPDMPLPKCRGARHWCQHSLCGRCSCGAGLGAALFLLPCSLPLR